MVASFLAGTLAAVFWLAGDGRLEESLHARPVDQGKLVIVETPHGTVMAGSLAKAQWAAQRLRETASRFVVTFGVHPGQGVIVESTYVEQLMRFDEDRRKWALPWPPEGFGPDDRVSRPQGAGGFDSESNLRHELNHLFLTATLFAGAAPDQYGSSAPDWFEEAVAIAGETTAMKARRRDHFVELLCAGRLVPLDRFLVRPHPLFASQVMQRQLADARVAARDAPTLAVVDVQRLDISEQAIADFYAQSMALAEFLAQTTNNPNILGRVGQALRQPADARGSDALGELAALTDSGGRSLAGRFEEWARARAAAATPGCRVSAPSLPVPKG